MRKNEAQRYIKSTTPRQSGFNPTEMLWPDLKQAIHAQTPSSVAESKFCKEKWVEIPPQGCETLIESYHMTEVLAAKGGGELLGPGRFG